MLLFYYTLIFQRKIYIGFLYCVLICFSQNIFAQTSDILSGKVTDGTNSIPGAIVRLQATNDTCITNNNGLFRLQVKKTKPSQLITAWKDGYFIGSTNLKDSSNLEIILIPLPITDNLNYNWIDPTPNHNDKVKNCGDCHDDIYKQWTQNGHAQSAVNPLFMSMYNGTDFYGKRDVAPGYRLDYPHSFGNCANCHAPIAALKNTTGINMNTLKGVEKLGVSCDFCHKIKNIHLKENTSVNSGVMMTELLRPPENHELFFGPYTDVPEPDTYNPEINKSIFCAPCHQGSFWGIPIYESYSEWLKSSYAKEGIQCQDCHMKTDSITTNFAPGHGGVERDPLTIHTHFQKGSRDSSFLASSVEMSTSTNHIDNILSVKVKIKNIGAGHHVPTDQPMRNLILLITAVDSKNNELKYIGENKIPYWGGRGNPDDGNYEGLPGKGFAKVLFENYSPFIPLKVGPKYQQIYPAPQWRTVKIKYDTRIPALATDVSNYKFSIDESTSNITVICKLFYRRTFKNWAAMKKWDLKDILIAENVVKIQK